MIQNIFSKALLKEIIGGRIVRRLTVAVILFSTLIAVFATGLQLYFDFNRDVKQINDEIEKIKTTLLSPLSESVWAIDGHQVQIQLDALQQLPDIEYVAVQVDGKDKWGSGERKYGNVIETYIPFVRDFRGKQERFGTLYIVATLDAVYLRLIDKALVILLTNAFKTFLVSGFILAVLRFLLTRHLETLAAFARNTELHKLSEPFQFNRQKKSGVPPDELDDLANSFNSMRANIDQSYQSLQEAHDTMEGRIEERTRHLEYEITKRERTEEMLKKNQAQLLEAQRIARLGNWSRDVESGRLHWSDEVYRIFGREPREFTPTYDQTLKMIHPDDMKSVESSLEKAFLERTSHSLEYRIVRPDGEILWVHVNSVPTFDESGKPVGISGTLQDITERKQVEEALKASEARLTEIFDIAPEAVITVNRGMNIQLFNQGAERIFGYKADEVLGRSLDILMPEHLRDGHRKHVEGFDGSGDTYRLMDQRQEIIGLRKDGTEFPASASVSKLEIGGEKIFTVMLHDITERKHAQDALVAAKGEAETANRAKSEFLAAMSHDFRTPLNAILGFAEILSLQYFGPINDKYREYAEDIKSSGEHLLTLVTEILDLSTIEAGKQSLVKEKLSTEEIIKECERIIKEKARSLGIDLVTKVPKDLPPLYADRRAAKQILLNLLSNAVKFTPQGGKVTLSAKASNRNTTLKIADTGKGIPAEKLPNLTDPFTRADTNPYLAEQGWGLGLTITKSLIDLHDGTLDIKSKLGKGTTVTVTFPNGAP